MASFGAPPVSLRHGVRVVAQAASTVEQVLLAVGDQEKAKGALIRACFTSMRDIDAPTTFFFNLERSVGQRKQMVCLRLPDGQVTSEPAEMRRHAVSFYTDLFKAEGCDVEAADELFQGLPQLSPAESDTLGSDITLEELTSAVTQMASGKAPGIDGLPADFFKHFWSMLGHDLLDVLMESFGKGTLPASCRRAVISLLPKKGDLTLLKNWRPVALLCGGGLSRPVPVKRGIRQGCPISGLLYSIAIEPLLCRLRNRLRGLCLPESAQAPPVVVSAYADDVSVFIQGQRDIQELQDSLALYRKAASAKVNWEKSEAVLVGQWSVGNRPSLPGNLGWGNRGLKVLGVWLGSEDMVAQNWEGLLGKVQAKLAKWKWLLPQLSYRGRVLVANNLVASSLWHRLQVLTPPPGLMKQLQRLLVDFFWSGHHWVPASVLYLPVAEGGQGLVDITARTAAFRLQAAQRLLYGASPCWLAMARLLLWRAGGFGFDKHLFLLKAPAYEITGLAPFYCSVINAWKILSFTRPPDPRPGMWLFEEPLFDTGFLSGTLFSSATLRNAFVEAGVVKLGHLTGISTEKLAEVTGIRSIRVLENLVDEVWQSLSPSHRTFALDADLADQWRKGHDYVFPALSVGCGGMERGGWSPAITGDSNTWKVQLLQWKEAIS
ncbi:hypothetical protein NHX12_033248 [Muraenolepis orangiensis]|uniref:Reverse transcriptase domain-containing protein n=1 Tax=Muraenolepis orangiensis TaxID=630683 RepID=A0A9Q0E5M6_9TELE|nr:hypothetical protein NHX12_033248 [Muraenolepis orangiensis]